MDPTDEQRHEAAEWAAQIYFDRTVALAEGGGSTLDVHPAYRVSWHEITGQFPYMNGPDERVAFQLYFEDAIRKRGLIKVLKGQETALDWYIKKNTLRAKKSISQTQKRG